MDDLNSPSRFELMLPGKQARVRRWISDNMEPSKTYGKHTSYGLKHFLERDIGMYLTNGEFKGAMLEFRFFPKNEAELNWVFKAIPSVMMLKRIGMK